MTKEYADTRYNNDLNTDPKSAYFYALFDTMIDPKYEKISFRGLYFFCRRWQQMGGEI